MGQPLEARHLAGAEWFDGSGAERTIVNPADASDRVARFREASPADAERAVAAARGAFPEWRATPAVARGRILFRAKESMERAFDDVARLLVRENGKTLAEARGELRRGLEVVEYAAGAPELLKGEYLADIARNLDGYQFREPLGVAVGIAPFNFPAMIPLWMVPLALACGNTFVLKPSEQCPLASLRLAELFLEAGLPPGVLNVVAGGRDAAAFLTTHPAVKAVSFVGSTPAAAAVWTAATAAGKRVQALGGAKNRLVVMPDADPAATVKGVVDSSFGCAGERCMATSLLVLVAGAEGLLPAVVGAAAALRVANGLADRVDMGPLVSAEHRRRVLEWIEVGVAEGAEVLLDGRGVAAGDGHFLGPTILDRVTPAMRVAKAEIFGPVLGVMRAGSLAEAMEWVNDSAFGNGASIFTRSGAAARFFRDRAECGMLGVNAGVPAPMAFFGFGGRRDSFRGDLKMQGRDAVAFFTQQKSVIERWDASGVDATWSR